MVDSNVTKARDLAVKLHYLNHFGLYCKAVNDFKENNEMVDKAIRFLYKDIESWIADKRLELTIELSKLIIKNGTI